MRIDIKHDLRLDGGSIAFSNIKGGYAYRPFVIHKGYGINDLVGWRTSKRILA